MKRRIGPGIALLAIALLLAGWWTARAAGDDGGIWLEVDRRDLVIGVPVEGELASVDSVLLGAPQVEGLWNFKIAFLAPEGSEVKEGQPVLAFDTTELQQRLLQQTAERDATEKELEKKTTDLTAERRQLRLDLAQAQARLRKVRFDIEVPESVTSRRDLEKARIDERLADLEIARVERRLQAMDVKEEVELGSLRIRRDRAARQLSDLQANLAALTVPAPRAGTVILRTDWRNEKKKVGDQVWREEKVVEIPDLDKLRVEGEVAEADSGRLTSGQAVTFRLDAYPDREYRGTVATVRRTVQRRSARNPAKVVRVTLDIESTDTERMRPGMRMRGRIEIERIPDVTVVPATAVSTGPEGPSVQIRGLLGTEKVFPQLGRRDDAGFQVLEGLSSGDRVLASGRGDGP
ncbi:MAG: HlyD family efflux transporter periplasmic adaptor subunit [Acidobacteriota bacterium]